MVNCIQDIIKSVRVLSAEQVEAAKSGHPGTPLGAAPEIVALYAECMKISPENPRFFNRDRFVLSSGHASAMLYSTLHVCGYDVEKSDLMSFRQADSRTPGHPEIGLTAGVDCSTGPLGQGIANAVGMALAEKILAAKYNRPDCKPIDHYTFALCGDGCMMEGIENEAASLAAIWGLDKLILIYDSNGITIEGKTDIAFTEDVAARHKALGWHVQRVDSAENVAAFIEAVNAAKAEKTRPSLIIVSSTIGYGAPNAGTSSVHGAPLGAEGIKHLKEVLGWTCEPFCVPESVHNFQKDMRSKGRDNELLWNEEMAKYKALYPELYEELLSCIDGTAAKKAAVSEELSSAQAEDMATRNLCGEMLGKVDKLIPNLLGGSADLATSNCTAVKGKEYYSVQNPSGTELHFGIREHAMAAICNGIALHGGFVPFCATFFVFSDYMKNAMRMSAIMKLPVIYILSHDSIGVGEDGPTHQPIEQLAALRSMPDMYAFRPSDGTETAAAFSFALKGIAPTAIITSRQKLVCHKLSSRDKALKGGYILSDSQKTPDVILMASGSEVGLCLEAQRLLKERDFAARVVSMPCMELFEEQSEEYRESVLPRSVRARVAVEAASSLSWGRYVGIDGAYVCLDNFGESAPAGTLFKKFGFTAQNVSECALGLIKDKN